MRRTGGYIPLQGKALPDTRRGNVQADRSLSNDYTKGVKYRLSSDGARAIRRRALPWSILSLVCLVAVAASLTYYETHYGRVLSPWDAFFIWLPLPLALVDMFLFRRFYHLSVRRDGVKLSSTESWYLLVRRDRLHAISECPRVGGAKSGGGLFLLTRLSGRPVSL